MSDAIEKIEANRDGLEELAKRDVPCAWVAQELLEIVDDE